MRWRHIGYDRNGNGNRPSHRSPVREAFATMLKWPDDPEGSFGAAP
ncbi:MAG: hypothetical protein HKP58_05675 [Desulfatitalea sp.]|nr:hypothetical protein [Desulfatitalea sp.]NNJ99884.1 hypothetical protein [Desulfatitalea sp.]